VWIRCNSTGTDTEEAEETDMMIVHPTVNA